LPADRQAGKQASQPAGQAGKASRQAGRQRGTFGTRCTWVASHRRFAMGWIHKREDARGGGGDAARRGAARRGAASKGDEGASERARARKRRGTSGGDPLYVAHRRCLAFVRCRSLGV